MDTEADKLYYVPRGTDGGKFGTGENGGRIKVKAGVIPDHEAKTWRSATNVSDR